MRYYLKISYDGTAYAGWQRQKNALSVQETLEDAFLQALSKPVKITASGRTDAGVHAVAQVCHLDVDEITVPAEKLPDCVNRFLPPDIKVLEGAEAKEGFDAIKSAKRKTYRYSLYVSQRELPLKERYAVKIEDAPCLEKLQEIARLFEGEHDYKAFCATGSSAKTTARTVYEVKVEERIELGVRNLDIYVTGNGFLYNMVRTIVGTLIEISLGKKDKDKLLKAYETGQRDLLGKTMPAKGLTLYSVEYDG